MISDWVFHRVFFPVFVCFRKAIKNKIASHCAGQSRVMEVLMKTAAEMMGSGKTKVNHTQRGSGKFDLAAAALEIFIRTKKNYQLLELHGHIWAVGPSKPSAWALKRPEPTGLVGDAEQGLGDEAASSSPPVLPSALPSDFMEALSWENKWSRKRGTLYLWNPRQRSGIRHSNSCT